jgi:hypothetical protein
MNMKINYCFIFLAFVLFYPGKSFGYIDPGSGSYFFQILLASLLGAIFALKIFWTKVKDFFKKIFRAGRNDGN